MQTLYSDKKAVSLSVCSSVRLSVKRVDCDKTNSIDFQADYITVVEGRPIMSVKYCLLASSSLPLLAKTITLPAARSLCDR